MSTISQFGHKKIPLLGIEELNSKRRKNQILLLFNNFNNFNINTF